MSRISVWLTVMYVAMMVVLSGCSSSPPISVSLSSTSPQVIDQGSPVVITAFLTNDRSSKGVRWTLSGAGSLGPSTATSVTYTAPTTSLARPEKIAVTATSVADPSKSATWTITVNPYLAIPIAQSLADGTVGTSYSQTITLTGGTAPFDWSVYNGPIETGWKVGGSIPDGLKLDPGTGTISGTPTAAGTWYFEASVTDSVNVTAENGFLSIQIKPSSTTTTANPVPFLNQPLKPAAVAPGRGDLTLNVSGTGFVSGATVNFNGRPITTTYIDDGHLSAQIPAENLTTAHTASITVLNPASGGGQSNVVYFPVAAPATTISFAQAANSPYQLALPFAIVAADFNEDGKPDLAVGSDAGLYTMLGNGDGTFATVPGSLQRMQSPPYDDFASPYAGPLALGDFNHSGHLGVVINLIQNQAAEILLGTGDGTFSPSSSVFAGAPMYSPVLAADFNRDGNLDLAFWSFVDLGYGDGAFTPWAELRTNSLPEAIVAGDFNEDGKLDLIVADGGSTVYPDSGISVSLGNGDGTFTPGSAIPLGSNLSAVVAADFNGDGKLDIAVTDSVANSVIVLLGDGHGVFGAPLTMPAGNTPLAIVTGDFNDDGRLDLAIANSGDNSITLLLGNGNGTFTEATGSPYPVGKGPYAIAAADFNGDGRLDLAVANSADGTVSILLQQ